MYLTLKDCAELAHINVSSARFYKDKEEFRNYFKTSGEGKKIKYEQDSTVELLSFISKSYAEGLDADQIVELMDSRFGMIVTDLATQEPDNNTETTQQEDLVHSLRHVLLEELAKQNHIILKLQDELENMKAEFKEGLAGDSMKVENGHRDAESRDLEVMQKLNDIKLIQQQRNKRTWWKFFSK